MANDDPPDLRQSNKASFTYTVRREPSGPHIIKTGLSVQCYLRW